MRTSLLCSLLAASISVLVAEEPKPAAPAPEIHFEKQVLDLGKISQDRKVTGRFKVSNKGTANLQISKINPSCGCTSTVLGKWNLAPNESTEIEAVFNPAGMRGRVVKSIQVISDDPKNGVVNLRIEAEVIQEIMVEPPAVFMFDVARTETRKALVRFKPGTDQPVKLTEVKVPGASYVTTSLRHEGKEGLVEVVFDASKVPSGVPRNVEKITVQTTNPKLPTLTVDLQWMLRAAIQAMPERLVWNEPVGKELKQSFQIKHSEGKAFKIKDIKSSNPKLLHTSAVSPEAANTHDLTVNLVAGASSGRYAETISVFTDDPAQPLVVIPINVALR